MVLYCVKMFFSSVLDVAYIAKYTFLEYTIVTLSINWLFHQPLCDAMIVPTTWIAQ